MSVAEGSSSHPVSRKNGFDPNQPFEEVSKANRTAPIWKLFTQLGQLNKLFGKCHRCGQVYAGSNSTLERHEFLEMEYIAGDEVEVRGDDEMFKYAYYGARIGAVHDEGLEVVYHNKRTLSGEVLIDILGEDQVRKVPDAVIGDFKHRDFVEAVFEVGDEIEVNGKATEFRTCFYTGVIIRLLKRNAEIRYFTLKSDNGAQLTHPLDDLAEPTSGSSAQPSNIHKTFLIIKDGWWPFLIIGTCRDSNLNLLYEGSVILPIRPSGDGLVDLSYIRPKPIQFRIKFKWGDFVDVWVTDKWCKGRYVSDVGQTKSACIICSSDEEDTIYCERNDIRASLSWEYVGKSSNCTFTKVLTEEQFPIPVTINVMKEYIPHTPEEDIDAIDWTLLQELHTALDESQSKRPRCNPTSLDELSIYRGSYYASNVTDDELTNLDILKWWKEREHLGQYKVLASMARDVLTVQASSVASECCFSLSGRILSARRCMLTAESVQMSVMLKDYYDSMERVQNNADLEEGLSHMEADILEDEFEKRAEEVSSYTNTDVDVEEEFIVETQDQDTRQSNFTNRSGTDRCAPLDTIDKLKASNFQAIHLNFLDGRLKNKIEIQWEDIIGLKANFLEDGGAILSVTVGKEPLYFREMNPLPRKHTIWQESSDFTGGEVRNARYYLFLLLIIILHIYEWNSLTFCLGNAQIQGSIKASNVPHNIVSYNKPTILEGSIKAPNVPHNIVSNYKPTILEGSIKAPNIPHNIVSNYIPEMSLVPCLDSIIVQPFSQANFSKKDIGKNYINARQDVNDCYNHDDMILSTSNCLLLKDGNSSQKDTNREDHVNGTQDGYEYSNLLCNLPPDDYYVKQEWEEEIGNASDYKQDPDMPRNDSLTDFMYQITPNNMASSPTYSHINTWRLSIRFWSHRLLAPCFRRNPYTDCLSIKFRFTLITVQLMWEEKKRTNAWQWPEQEPTEFSGEKRALMELKENKEDELPLPKRPKPSSLTTNEWHSEYNRLKGPGPLGSKLDHSAFIEQHQKTRNQAHKNGGSSPPKNLQMEKKKDVKATFGTSDKIEKLKASNFPAMHLKIGRWEYTSQHEGHLVAKCYYAKHKLVWEVLDGGLKNKIEIKWEDIVGLQANFPENGNAILAVTVGKEPLYFRETNPVPRKHTIWQPTSDFTGGEARNAYVHYIKCEAGVLDKHYEKLLLCDTRLAFLSQHFQTVLQNPFPEACIKAPNIPHNIVSIYNPTILEGSIKAPNVPHNIVSNYKPKILEGSIKAPNVPHNIVSNYKTTILEGSIKAPKVPHNIVSNYKPTILEGSINAPNIPHNIVSIYNPTILEGSIKAPNVPHNIVSNYKPTILEGSIKAPNVPHNIVSNYKPTILEGSINAPNIPHNIVSNYTPEISLVPCFDPIVVQPISQANFSEEDIGKNYINAWQDVNDCYNHDDMILSTSNCLLVKDANSAQKYTSSEDHVNGRQDGNDYSNLVCNLPSDDYFVKQVWEEEIGNASDYKQDPDMPRNDSLTDFMIQLPSITPDFLSDDHDLFYP
ncbi:hypothetical protein LXL04_002851 [Taraxacum kok-saghyz]